jgi:NADH-quinone oxidoreductase subunit N
MLVFMVSLAGIPPTAGFVGKFFIFWALIETGHTVLAVIGAVYAVVAIYYYFRIVKAVFVEPEEAEAGPLTVSLGTRVGLVVTGVLTLALGVYPEPILRLAQMSISR